MHDKRILLWQRIFACALLLVIAAQVGTILLFTQVHEPENSKRYLLDRSADFAAGITGRDLESARTVVQLFNRNYRKMWLESPAGDLLAGVIPENLAGHLYRDFFDKASDKTALYETKLTNPRFLTRSAVELKEGAAVFYMSVGSRPAPPVESVLLQGLLGVAVFGGLISFWVARRVSRPLVRLRSEVLEIADGNFDKRVSETGNNEITDVAKAVNQMTDNLARHIRGMRELVMNISHELRSPLTRMSISSLMVERGLNPEGQGEPGQPGQIDTALALKHLAGLQEEMRHMERLIGETLLSSRLDLQDDIALSDVEMSDLTLAMAERQAPLFQERGLAAEYAVQPGLRLQGDENLLCRLVSNLLDNAGKYTEPGGQVLLSLQAVEGTLRLCVKNTHAPFPEEEASRLFEPFYRAGRATGDGVGLGLHLVRKIVDLHHGWVRFANEPPYVAVHVELPLTPSTGA